MRGFNVPWRPLFVAAAVLFICLVPLLTFGAPLYDEYVWTKKAWGSYKLSFPLDNIPGKPGSGGPAYSSVVGPFKRDFYRDQLDKNKAAR
jgi:hypothetical protein